jgi:hypothetical protein
MNISSEDLATIARIAAMPINREEALARLIAAARAYAQHGQYDLRYGQALRKAVAEYEGTLS